MPESPGLLALAQAIANNALAPSQQAALLTVLAEVIPIFRQPGENSGLVDEESVSEIWASALYALDAEGAVALPAPAPSIVGSGRNIAIAATSSLVLGPFAYDANHVLDAIVFPLDMPAASFGTWGGPSGSFLTWAWTGPPGSPAHLFVRNAHATAEHFSYLILAWQLP